MIRSSVLLSLLLAAITTTSLVKGEQVPRELPWSSEKCTELGYGSGRFDYCAEIEFCEGYGEGVSGGYRHHHDRRQLRGKKRELQSMEMYDEDGEMMEEETEEPWDNYGEGFYDEQGNSVSPSEPAFREAKFGWSIPGEDCSWPGPLMRFTRGKTYGLFVRGSGDPDTITNIHTHGLHIPGHGNSDDVTRSVSGSDVIIYEYRIPSYHMGGTHWYHSHWHHHSEHHVGGGAFGMIVVDDGDENENVGENIDEGVKAFLKNEKIFIASNHEDMYGPWIVNGVTGRESYDLNSDEWYRFRIMAVNLDSHSSSRTITFGDECEAYAVAQDGIFRFEVPASTPQSSFMLGDASRRDVAVRCRSNSEISINDAVVASIRTSQASSSNNGIAPSPFLSSGESWRSRRPDYIADLRSETIDSTLLLKLDETKINEQTFSLDEPFCPDIQYGSVHEWTLNLSYHPFHLHIFPMQVISENNECGEIHEYGEFYDTITLRNENRRGGKCKVRIAFRDVGGKTLMQCHVLKHGDQGSMAFMHVVGGPTQESEPRVHECSSGTCDEPVNVPTCDGGYEYDN